MTRRGALGVALVAVAAAVVVVLAVRARPAWRRAAVTRTALPARALVVYHARTRDLTLLTDPLRPDGPQRRLDCAGLPEWALRVGAREDQLVLLDARRPAILTVSREALRRIALGRARCDATVAPLALRVPLAHGKTPYGGVLDGDRLFVSFFGDNLVEVYRFADGVPRWERDIVFAASESLGLSDLVVRGDTLVVAGSGFICGGPHCPDGQFHDSTLFFVAPAASWPFPTLTPANHDGAGLYAHPDDGALWVLNAGDFAGGYGSLQRLVDEHRLGPELRLPRGAAPARALRLDARHFVVRQFAGEHLFVVDGVAGRLARIERLDEAAFTAVAPSVAALPERSASDVQDIVADPADGGRFWIVDSKRERLVRARFDAGAGALRFEGATSLGGSGGGGRSGPSWAVWLD